MKLPFVLRSTYENYEHNTNSTMTDYINRERTQAATLVRIQHKMHKQNNENSRLKSQVAGLKLNLSKYLRERDDEGKFVAKK